MSRTQRTTYAFNKVLADFILSAKQQSQDLKNLLRKHYRVVDNTSTAELDRWNTCLTDDIKSRIVSCGERAQLVSAIGELEVFQGCTLSMLVGLLPEAYHDTLMCHVYTLALITLVYRDGNSLEDGDDDGHVLEKVLEAVAASQCSIRGVGDGDKSNEILDDDYRAIVQRIRESVPFKNEDDEGGPEIDMTKLMDSKIGKLAAEISQEIDPAHLDMANPMDMLNLQKLADGTSPLGEIITKVGGKIQGKLASGELNQGELIAEAVNMLKLFDKNNALGSMFPKPPVDGQQQQLPSLADFASMFANMAPPANNSNNNNRQQQQQQQTRDRLRAKLTSPSLPARRSTE